MNDGFIQSYNFWNQLIKSIAHPLDRAAVDFSVADLTAKIDKFFTSNLLNAVHNNQHLDPIIFCNMIKDIQQGIFNCRPKSV